VAHLCTIGYHKAQFDKPSLSQPMNLPKLRVTSNGHSSKPRAIDLFSGCGGMTQGLKLAGFQVIGAVDNDPLSVETYKKNHKKVRVWEEDIRTLSVREVKKALGIRKGEVELVAGCPPCQGFSTMRTLNGSKCVLDQQKDLVFEFMRFVRELRPRAVMLENVPALSKDRRMRLLVKELNQLGYTCNWGVMNAADHGVPQRRKRVILLGSLSDRIDFAPPSPNRRTVRNTIGNMPPAGKSGDPLHDLTESRSTRIVKIIKSIPRNGGSRVSLGKRGQLRCHKEFNGFKDVYGRMPWDEVAPTITGGCINPSKGRFLHPVLNRAITLREAALLQTFPPRYFFSLRRGKLATAALIGNALPPQFVKGHARQVLKHLKG
jgi:DNA (cytosine-5)-methyltransferase 1